MCACASVISSFIIFLMISAFLVNSAPIVKLNVKVTKQYWEFGYKRPSWDSVCVCVREKDNDGKMALRLFMFHRWLSMCTWRQITLQQENNTHTSTCVLVEQTLSVFGSECAGKFNSQILSTRLALHKWNIVKLFF